MFADCEMRTTDVNCQKCWATGLDSGAEFCGQCGTRLQMGHISKEWLVGLSALAVAIGILLSSRSNQDNAATTQIGQPTPEKPAKPSRELARVRVKIVKFSWKKEAFDTVMQANFTIRNDNDLAVKDLKITCEHAAPSGTLIDRNTRTLYEVIRPHATRSFRNFDMGFIHSQAAHSGCEVTDLVVMGQ